MHAGRSLRHGIDRHGNSPAASVAQSLAMSSRLVQNMPDRLSAKGDRHDRKSGIRRRRRHGRADGVEPRQGRVRGGRSRHQPGPGRAACGGGRARRGYARGGGGRVPAHDLHGRNRRPGRSGDPRRQRFRPEGAAAGHRGLHEHDRSTARAPVRGAPGRQGYRHARRAGERRTARRGGGNAVGDRRRAGRHLRRGGGSLPARWARTCSTSAGTAWASR